MRLAIKTIDKYRSGQTYIDALKYRLLFHKRLNETSESIDNMTIDELISINEEIDIQDFIEAAHHAHIKKNNL